MNRLLATLLLLSIPALVHATDYVDWSTYCDGVVEKVSFSMIVHIGGAHIDEEVGEMSAFNNEDCHFAEGGGQRIWEGTAEDLGDGNFRLTWEGWLRSYLTVSRPAFYGTYWIWVPDELTGERRYYPRDFDCFQFEPAFIVDNSTCAPLPVASTTWGAIKALYR